MPTNAELMELIERLETTIYGDPSRDKKGLVERVNQQEAYMTEIRDTMKKLQWLLIMGVAGAALNLILNTKNIAAIYHPPQIEQKQK